MWYECCLYLPQVVTFYWDDTDGAGGQNVMQVFDDDGQLRSAAGGFNNGNKSKTGKYEQQFNLAGEYKFKR